MSSSYPGTIDSFTNPTAGQNLNNPSHSEQHANANDAIEAIENVLGTTAGTSVLKDFNAGQFPVRTDSTGLVFDNNNNPVLLLTGGTTSENYFAVDTGSGFGASLTATGTANTVNANLSVTGLGTLTIWQDYLSDEMLKIKAVNGASNEVTISPATSGNAPLLEATGSDSNIDLKLSGKGTGVVTTDRAHIGIHTVGSAVYQGTASGTVTLDFSTATRHLVNMPNSAGSVKLAVSNVRVNQPVIVEILQGTAGLGTVGWFSTIKWAEGGTAPTLTTTASKKDTFGFMPTGTASFDGFVIGQII